MLSPGKASLKGTSKCIKHLWPGKEAIERVIAEVVKL